MPAARLAAAFVVAVRSYAPPYARAGTRTTHVAEESSDGKYFTLLAMYPGKLVLMRQRQKIHRHGHGAVYANASPD